MLHLGMSSEPAVENSCANCKYAGTYRRKQVMENTGFGDGLMFKDADVVEKIDADGNPYKLELENEVVYICRGAPCTHAGTEIGPVPILCEAWTEAKKMDAEKLAELDRMIAAREARVKARGE